MGQTYNGQEYQHANLDLQIGPSDSGFTFTFTKFSKLSLKTAAEKKEVQDSQGQNCGYTIMPEKNEGSMSTLQSEWKEFKEQMAQRYPDLGIGQIEFSATITYGNSLAKLMTDKVQFMFNEEPRSSESNQDALMVDLPLFVYHFEPHGGPFIRYRKV